MVGTDPLMELGALLDTLKVKRVLVPQRLVPSAIYDAEYHVAVIACAFRIHAVGSDGRRGVIAMWMKLLQFVAVRPGLLPDVLEWAGTRRRPTLETWKKMPRGFVADSTHDAAIDFLLAHGVLDRLDNLLVEAKGIARLDSVAETIWSSDLFREERRVLVQLASLKPNVTMLSGS